MMPAHDTFDRLGFPLRSGGGDFHTIAGLALSQLGHLKPFALGPLVRLAPRQFLHAIECGNGFIDIPAPVLDKLIEIDRLDSEPLHFFLDFGRFVLARACDLRRLLQLPHSAVMSLG
jgi:hypothetical protein